MMEENFQILLVMTVIVLAVISPGPDFALVTRNSILFSRRSGIATAFGIAAGVGVHITYTVFGLGYVLSSTVWILEIMRYAGAAYLIWLGLSAFRSQKIRASENSEPPENQKKSAFYSFRSGFICNALNPKTALFFIALFTQVVDENMSQPLQAGLGLFIALVHFVWFALVSLFLTLKWFRQYLAKATIWIERLTGGCLVALGLKLAVTE